MRQCCVYWKVVFKVKGWRNQMSNEGQLLFYPHLDLAAMCLPKSSVRIVEKCELANICCHHLVPANDWGQQGQETDANDVFFNFARMQAAESHTYALCNYLVKQPQMKTYLIFYFLFHTEPTGLWQLESDCTKAPNPNQNSLTNIHSMNNKRYEALLDGSYFCWTSMENADFKLMYKTPNWSWFLKPVFHLNLETQMWAGNIEKQKPV